MALTSLTQLEAVNLMLSVIGEAPIQSLTDTGVATVDTAKRLLDDVSREVQSAGWHFNTQYNWPLAIDVDGHVPVPSNAVRVDVDQNRANASLDVTVRDNRLYDLYNRTFVFTVASPIKVQMVELLAFSNLPDAARRYIAIRAARKLQDRVLGDSNAHGYSAQDEIEAKAALMTAESDTSDATIFDHYSVYRTIER